MMLAEFGTGQVFWSLLWLFLFVTWFSLIISVFSDMLRDSSTSGMTKAFWTLAILVIPFLGVLTYLVINGDSMNERAQKAASGSYARPDTGEELARLASLHSAGNLTDAEFEQAKARVLS
jgi:hypothetical protein